MELKKKHIYSKVVKKAHLALKNACRATAGRSNNWMRGLFELLHAHAWHGMDRCCTLSHGKAGAA